MREWWSNIGSSSLGFREKGWLLLCLVLRIVHLNLPEQRFGEVGLELSFLLPAATFRKTTEVLILVSRDADLAVVKSD